jgi:hypothetical protein
LPADSSPALGTGDMACNPAIFGMGTVSAPGKVN